MPTKATSPRHSRQSDHVSRCLNELCTLRCSGTRRYNVEGTRARPVLACSGAVDHAKMRTSSAHVSTERGWWFGTHTDSRRSFTVAPRSREATELLVGDCSQSPHWRSAPSHAGPFFLHSHPTFQSNPRHAASFSDVCALEHQHCYA